VAQLLDQRLNIGGDHGFIFDDQHIRGQLGVDVALSRLDQAFDLPELDAQDLRRLARREAFHGGKKERLPGGWRDTHQVRLRGVQGG
jgi:hypothetical protein